MTTFSCYLKKITAFILILMIAIVIFNLTIDPFKLFHLLGDNKAENKPEFYKHLRMAKAHNIRVFKPDGIVLGTSRAEFGIDPEHPGWKAKKRYNLALSSANIYEVYRYLQHAQAVKPLKEVVIGLDFFMFNANKTVEIDFSESRLQSPSSFLSTGWYRDLFQSLLTQDALTASWETLRADPEKPAIRYNKNGFRDDSNNWHRIIEAKGHRNASIKSERYTLLSLDGYPFFTLTQPSDKKSPLQVFEELLLFCIDNNINLKLFISPTHARTLKIIHLIGFWDEFETWKRQLVSSTANISPTTPLWDFSGFNSITTEPFPELYNIQTQMKWYWESSHYKKEVGNIILDKLFSIPVKESAPEHFGVQLLPQNIDEHLVTINQERSYYEKMFPNEVNELKALIEKTHEQRLKLYAEHPEIESVQTF